MRWEGSSGRGVGSVEGIGVGVGSGGGGLAFVNDFGGKGKGEKSPALTACLHVVKFMCTCRAPGVQVARRALRFLPRRGLRKVSRPAALATRWMSIVAERVDPSSVLPVHAKAGVVVIVTLDARRWTLGWL